MKSKFNKKLIPILILALIVSFFVLKECDTNKTLIIKGRFTIAKIVKKKISRSCTGNVYIFKVNDQIYQNNRCSKYKGEIGKRYFVVYNPNKIEENRILINYPVPDSITNSPIKGWKQLPIPFDQKSLKKSIR